MAAAPTEELVECALQRAFVPLVAERLQARRRYLRSSGSRSPSPAIARSASAAARLRAARRSAGMAASVGSRGPELAARVSIEARHFRQMRTALAPAMRMIARKVRSANLRALRAARTSRASTRRLRVGREDGMSGGTVSNDRATFKSGRRRLQPDVEGEVAILEEHHRCPRYDRFDAGTSIPPAPARFRGGCSLSGSRSCFCWSGRLAGAVRHVVFIFLVALLIALLLNPLVRGVGTGLDTAPAPGGRDRLPEASQPSWHSRSSLSQPSWSSKPGTPATGSIPTLGSSPDAPTRPEQRRISAVSSTGSTSTT